MGNQADHAAIGIGLLLGNRPPQVDHRLAERLGHFCRVLRVDHDVGPRHEGVAHVLRQAHDIEEHRDRQRPAKGGVEVAFALVGKGADDVDGALADQPFQRLDASRAEQRVNNVAILAVMRRIYFLRDEEEIIIRIAAELAGIEIAEGLGMTQHVEAIVVLCQVP